MSMQRIVLPECSSCGLLDQGHPCRRADGVLDLERVAKTIVESRKAFLTDEIDQDVYAATRWASDCAYEIEDNHPELVLALVIAAMDACVTVEDAAFVAAGVVENMAVKHGPALIDSIELLARESPKFRFILSGIWSQGSVEPDVWMRIGRAVGAGGRMSDDGRGPWDGNPVTVLSDEEALELLKERIADTGMKMGQSP
jgi:hypothetical protein